MNRHIAEIILCSLLLLFWCGVPHAENADRKKPIHLESGRVAIDDTTRTSVFEGNVELIQGTLQIQGDKIVLKEDKRGYKHCTAIGKPASFRQKHEGSDEYMEGYGERIEYDTRAETVDFYVRARVKREQDDVKGNHIAYSTRTEIFRVSGDPDNINDPNKGRVHAVIQPRSKETTDNPALNDAPLTIQTSPTLSKPKP